MTLDEFLVEYHQLPADYVWTNHPNIRAIILKDYEYYKCKLEFCPITAVTFQKTEEFVYTCDYMNCCKLIDLNPEDACIIADASDNEKSKFRNILKRKNENI